MRPRLGVGLNTTSGRKISKGPRTIMLKIYVGSARDLSAKNNQNTKTARLILRLQPYFIGFCRVGVSQSQFFYVESASQFLYSKYYTVGKPNLTKTAYRRDDNKFALGLYFRFTARLS